MITETLIKTIKSHGVELVFIKQNNWTILSIEGKEIERVENFGKSDEYCIKYLRNKLRES